MELSLDEIIKQKNTSSSKLNAGYKNFVKKKKNIVKNNGFDARNTIIQKHRAKITDARERITTQDARDKLKLRYVKLMKTGIRKNDLSRNEIEAKKLHRTSSNVNFYGAPRGYIDFDNMETLEQEFNPSNMGLRRTVYNDVISNQGFYSGNSNIKRWKNGSYNLFDNESKFSNKNLEVMNIRQKMKNIYTHISNKNLTIPHANVHPKFNSENCQLSYEMRSRLESAPDPHTSMGIFASPSISQIHQIKPSSYRIVVSNLHSSVSQSDIQELFEDIGELNEARLVKPGVAEVIFKNIRDAEKAVDTYHNRQLDGQPMKCLLVNPRASNKPTAPALKVSTSTTLSNKSPLEIDIDALHKVLFRRK